MPTFPSSLPIPISKTLSRLHQNNFTTPTNPSNSIFSHTHHPFTKQQRKTPTLPFFQKPFLSTNDYVKFPTAPWMAGSLLLPSNEVLNLSTLRTKKGKNRVQGLERTDLSLTEKISGGRGRRAMRRIVESIKKLQECANLEEPQKAVEKFELRVPLKPVFEEENSNSEVRMPWMTEEKIVFRRMKERVVTKSELILSERVLKRLRNDAVKVTKWVEVKKAGVTEAIVDEIERILE